MNFVITVSALGSHRAELDPRYQVHAQSIRLRRGFGEPVDRIVVSQAEDTKTPPIGILDQVTR